MKYQGWNYARVPLAAILDERTTGTDIQVFTAMCTFADNNEGTLYPSYSTLAKRAKCSERTARYCVENLVKYGHVIKVKRKTGLTNQSNMYIIVTQQVLPYKKGMATDAVGVGQELPKGTATDAVKLKPNNYSHNNYREGSEENAKGEQPAPSSQPNVTNNSGNPDKFRKVELLEVDGEKYPVTAKRVERLKEAYGEKVFMDYVGRVIAYCDSKGKKYKDYAAAAENFMRRDGVQPIKNNPTPLGGDMLPY